MFKTITKCRICGNSHLTSVMDIGIQSLTGTFPSSKDEFVHSGPVELVKCTGYDACGLVQLRQSYDIGLMYGENYGYRSGLNASMVEHLYSKADQVLSKQILAKGDLVIDIGSNDGTTLGAYPCDSYKLIGVDPSGQKFKDHYPDGVALIADFFSEKVVRAFVGNQKAKVVTSFSMFYDLEDPVAFAREVAEILDDDGIWIFEQSYLPAMLEANSFDTICHEHLEFYSLKQIEWIAEKANLKVLDVEFNEINGGSFSVTVAKISSLIQPSSELLQEIRDKESMLELDGESVYKEFKSRVVKAKADLLEFLLKAKEEGKSVYGLGSSTKGNVLLQYFGIDENLLPLIGEVNEDKFGKFTPGTLIPIIPEEDIFALDPDYLLVLPWHFKPFFASLSSLKGHSVVYPLPNFEITTN